MKKIPYLLVSILFFFNCNKEVPTRFTEKALNDTFTSLEGNPITFNKILETNKNKTIVLDVWASWCSDCIKGMPKVKALQENHKDVTYIFLSLDKSHEAWKKGIEKYNVIGQHYFMESGWEGPFGEFIELDWIPRYMVIGKNGEIKLFKAIEADDKNILKL